MVTVICNKIDVNFTMAIAIFTVCLFPFPSGGQHGPALHGKKCWLETCQFLLCRRPTFKQEVKHPKNY